ncbi:hypothetical protein CAC42_5219 [Sphaceloma murrayae]|uniref:Carbonyl reductase family member 4 n=1 Tax=Sphaceloma murrayae TaxID=2082308 RepID=A0A2K1QUQ6_9PEZI|nr:hypothetical protein CAC42_5219 [Sphaceloma murrayae]
MSTPKVIVVTGANRGIGLAIAQKLSQQASPVHLYACSRSGATLPVTASTPTSKIRFATLDITKASSIESLVKTISADEGRLDILINNAGTNDTGSWGKTISPLDVINVNYHGTKNVCLALLPLLVEAKDSRIVNVSSTGSNLHHYSSEVKSTFRSADLKLSDLDALTDKYIAASKQGTAKEAGFGGANGYAVSKAAINALTAVLARENAKKGVVANCCCPGWVDTDMGNIVGKPSKTPEEGSRIPVRLAIGDIEGVTGGYWGNDGVSDRGDGKVQEW